MTRETFSEFYKVNVISFDYSLDWEETSLFFSGDKVTWSHLTLIVVVDGGMEPTTNQDRIVFYTSFYLLSLIEKEPIPK